MSTVLDAVSQSSNLYKILADYNTALSAAVLDTTQSSAYPEFKDVAQFIDYSELLRNCLNNQKSMPRFSNGASIETTHHAVAVLREENMCLMRKTSYITLQATEAATEADYYNKQGMFMASAIQGLSTRSSAA